MSARSRGMETCFIWMLNICLRLHLLVRKTCLDFTTHREASWRVPANQLHILSFLHLSLTTLHDISSESHLANSRKEFPWQGSTQKPAGRGSLEGSPWRKSVIPKRRKSKAPVRIWEEDHIDTQGYGQVQGETEKILTPHCLVEVSEEGKLRLLRRCKKKSETNYWLLSKMFLWLSITELG